VAVSGHGNLGFQFAVKVWESSNKSRTADFIYGAGKA
jgi:hypothetical protein